MSSTSEAINDLAAALAKAQGEMGNAALNKTNPHFKSKYADLAAIRDATIPALSKHGLSIVQYTESIAAGVLFHTRLMHSSGQWIDSSYPLDVDLSKPQAVGSALTYARRYGWSSMSGIASEEDDDANAAQEHAKPNGSSTWSAKAGANAADNSRFVYERLKSTLLKTKTEDSYNDWKARNQADIDSLSQDFFLTLKSECQLHKAGFPKTEKPLSQRAVDADKPAMPNDEIPF